MAARNLQVEDAVTQALERIDHFIAGGKVALPTAPHRRACEELLDGQRASVKVAAMFLMFYWLRAEDWDRDSVPVGTRGTYGDKRLSEELTRRHITLHDHLTAFAENLGW